MFLGAQQDIYDIAIIGCGPAGYSAALNAKIRNKKFILLGSDNCVEKTLKSPAIDNYLGFPGISGKELRDRFTAHINEMGITVTPGTVTTIFPQGGTFSLQVKNDFIITKSVIVTVGVTFANLIPGEAEYLGQGVSYCATCDGPLYKGKDVAIIGYTPEAEEEVAYLAEICQKVYFIQQYKNMERKFTENVEIITDKPTKISGLGFEKTLSIGEKEIQINGVFVIRKAVAPAQLVPGLELDGNHIKVNRDLETNIPGLFAAGDITGRPYQIAKAVGEGNTACLNAVSYLDKNN